MVRRGRHPFWSKITKDANNFHHDSCARSRIRSSVDPSISVVTDDDSFLLLLDSSNATHHIPDWLLINLVLIIE